MGYKLDLEHDEGLSQNLEPKLGQKWYVHWIQSNLNIGNNNWRDNRVCVTSWLVTALSKSDQTRVADTSRLESTRHRAGPWSRHPATRARRKLEYRTRRLASLLCGMKVDVCLCPRIQNVHTLRVARTFFFAHVPCVTYRHRVHAWLEVFAVRMSHISISLSASLLFPHGHFNTTFPSAPSSSSFTRPKKRGSSALPHERRGVWLPGRCHALHRL